MLLFRLCPRKSGRGNRQNVCFYAVGDELIPKSEIDDFANNNFGRLTVYNGGEHWIHKENDLRIMEEREENKIENFTD